MSVPPKLALPTDDQWEIEAVIAWHDDDARAAIATLLKDCHHLRGQLALAEGVMSRGITRGWLPAFDRDEASPRS